MSTFLKRFLPSFAWISEVPRSWKVDLAAGIGVAVVLIPQSMAYSQLAGVPAYVGMYSALIPLFIAALWGSSKFLSTGPTAVVSLMTFAGVASVVNPDANAFLASVILVTLLVGMFQLLFALLQLGKLIQLVSHSVIIGFSTAAALLILLSQLKVFFPAQITSHSHHVFFQLWEQLLFLDNINWWVPAFGLGSLLVIELGKKWKSSLPWTLGVIIVTTILSALGFYPGSVVGEVPVGLPSLGLPEINLESMRALLSVALIISLISYIESISIAKSLAVKSKTIINASRELISLAFSNIGSALSGGMPVAGSFSRSAFNYSSGVKTPLASIVTGCVMLVALLFLTPYLYYLPRVVLAAIIIGAVLKLIAARRIKQLFSMYDYDGYVAFVTFLATFVFSPHLDYGILIGIVLSIFVQLYHVAYPEQRIINFGDKRKCKKEGIVIKDYATNKYVLGVDITQDITFANAEMLQDSIIKEVNNGHKIKYVVIMGRGLHFVDATGVEVMKQLAEHLHKEHILLLFTRIEGPLQEFFAKVRLDTIVGKKLFFSRVGVALEYIHRQEKKKQHKK